jgi:hypothetical protein
VAEIDSAFDSKVQGAELLPEKVLQKTLPVITVATATARLWARSANAEPLPQVHVRQKRTRKIAKRHNFERSEHQVSAVNADRDDDNNGEEGLNIYEVPINHRERLVMGRFATRELRYTGGCHAVQKKKTCLSFQNDCCWHCTPS